MNAYMSWNEKPLIASGEILLIAAGNDHNAADNFVC